jgi:hypothetical protein
MLLVGKCKKCDTTIKLDVKERTLPEAIETLKKMDTFHCPGHHVELCSPYPRYWNVDEWEFQEGAAPTDEEFLAELKGKYKDVCDTYEMQARDVITSFSYGLPMTNDGKNWDFTQSPSGKRYYFCNPI